MNSKNFPRNKERKQKEAVERQAYWNTLTHDQRRSILDTRPGKSARQRARMRRAEFAAEVQAEHTKKA